MKLKFNLLDKIILGILGLAILFLVYNIFFAGSSIFQAHDTETLAFQMEFRRMTPEFRSAISVGDYVYISPRERDRARVVEVSPARRAQVIEMNRVDGEFIVTEVPDHYDVVVTMHADVTVLPREFRNGSTAIRIGSETVMRGPGYAAEGFIIAMWIYGQDTVIEAEPDDSTEDPYENGYGYNGYNGEVEEGDDA